MFSSELPKKIKPEEMVRTASRIEGILSVADMPRLQPLVVELDTPVHVELVGGVDAGGVGFIKGQIEANLVLPCQRCLKPMQYAMTAFVSLSPVNSDQKATQLPDQYEPLLVGAEGVLLSEIVEDELILSFPLVAMHDDTECWHEAT
jgi:uncharacterized protein